MQCARFRRPTGIAQLALLALVASCGHQLASDLVVAPVIKTGTLIVAVAGPTGGSLPGFTLTDASGSRTLPAPGAFTLLPPGTYTLTADSVDTPRTRYAPDTAVRTVVVPDDGTTKNVVVQYAPSTGQLVVVGDSLPAGISAAVDVVDGGGIVRRANTGDTLWHLAEGAYTSTAFAVVRGNARYAPAGVATATVSRGTTTIAHTRFVGTASVVVQVTGLPPSVGALVDITLSDGTTRHISATSTIADVPFGSMSISATDIMLEPDAFRAPTLQRVVVDGNGPAVVSAAYTRILGSLRFNLTGLPAGLLTDGVYGSIFAANGDIFDIRSAATLTNLPLGSYLWIGNNPFIGGVQYVTHCFFFAVITLSAAQPDGIASCNYSR